MKPFIGDNFLLNNPSAEALYHDYAAKMPIIDYHNHLDPEAIASDYQFKNITEAWLDGDHYKWRAMRANGISEYFITGAAPDEEKFEKWADTVPFTMRNPLYHWTHLELQRYFGIDELLTPKSAKAIYSETTNALAAPDHGCRGLLKQMKVEVLCTTDDPADDLRQHLTISKIAYIPKVLPTFRPDKALALGDGKTYLNYLEKLGEVSSVLITSLDTLLEALENRIDFFNSLGGKLADHSFSQLPLLNQAAQNPEANFRRVLNGQSLSMTETEAVQAHILTSLGKMYHKRGWVQQFHLGVMRNNNSRAMRELGPDTGFDSMSDASQAIRLQGFLDHLDNTGQLAKTIIYNLNPSDNDLFATMLGNFNDGKVAGKMQFGAGWWFLDQKTGMENQMNTLSNMGLLSHFVGMLTDSRSFLSFPRHEYFRRILCNLIGVDIENGELPNDLAMLGKFVENICYYNAKKYFGFD